MSLRTGLLSGPRANVTESCPFLAHTEFALSDVKKVYEPTEKERVPEVVHPVPVPRRKNI